ncbi:hypothetical protein TKK_0000752 [Trichogramma kaykai]|uniref:Uncharacterized protein n=1 Tax=Trichogramma kaykai TaxID=54128 RepID=A0ABD2WPX5_9HYME
MIPLEKTLYLENGETDDLFLHNLIVNSLSDTGEYIRTIENYLDKSDENNINEQNSRGCTALHIAVVISNVQAIEALLTCGADINVADNSGKTPFTYCLMNYDRRLYKCNQMFFTFMAQAYKLQLLKLTITPENVRCYQKAQETYQFHDKTYMAEYNSELDKMEDVPVGNDGTTLRNFLYHGPRIIDKSTVKRRAVEEIVTTRDFYKEFPKLGCLIKLQYRLGVARRNAIDKSKWILLELVKYALPELCIENIINFLDTDDLSNVIKTFE